MPIRINLKELFGSDSQSITADKLNYNFNKLLELGVGLPGERGLTGIQGPAGPAGPTGPAGPGGNKWFVGSGDPNTQTFTGLIDGDFFLNSDNSEIWQYNSTADSWTLLVDLESVVTDYLTLAGVTFVRGVGDSSPDDERYIVFPNRGNDNTAATTDGIGGSSENDVLFLNNFNEKFAVVDIANFPSNTNDLYTALEKIFVDSTTGVPGRYHLELGSLFADTQGPDTNLLSSLKHNIKVRHVVDDLGGSYQYPSSNEYLYIGKLSLSKTEAQPTSELDYNSLWEFDTSKFNAEGASIVRGEVKFRFGSEEAIGEYETDMIGDGINITSGGLGAYIGVKNEFSNNNTSIDSNPYLVIKSSGTEAVLIDQDLIQDRGNITQLNSIGYRDIDQETSNYVVQNAIGMNYNLGIAVAGNRLYTTEGRSPYNTGGSGVTLSSSDLSGRLTQYNIQDGIAEKGFEKTGTGLSVGSYFAGCGACDLTINGDYIYVVNNQVNSNLTEYTTYQQANLQILSISAPNSIGIGKNNEPSKISQMYGWTTSEYIQELDGAWRVDNMGSHLVVAGNKLRQMETGQIIENTHICLLDVTTPREIKLDASYNQGYEHTLDMIVYEDYVIALNLELQDLTFSMGKTSSVWTSGEHIVKVVVYQKVWNHSYVTGPGSATNKRGYHLVKQVEEQIYFSDALVSPTNQDSETAISKIGSISTDGKWLYTFYQGTMQVFPIELTNWTSFSSVASYTYSTNGQAKPYDSKVSGGYLYVLHGDAATSSQVEKQYQSEFSYLDKINVSDPTNPYTEWSQQIDEEYGGYKFEIVGNRAYIATQSYDPTLSGTKKGGIITVELDGVVTGHANVANLKTDQAKVMMDLGVGGNAKVEGNLNIGNSVRINKDLSVGGLVNIRPPRGFNNTTTSKWGEGFLKIGSFGEFAFASADSEASGSYNFKMYDPDKANSNDAAISIDSWYGGSNYLAMGLKERVYINTHEADALMTFGRFGYNDQFRIYLDGWGGSYPGGISPTTGKPFFFFDGDTHVNGELTKNTGSFLIDHPLESKKETHKLRHSFIEGPYADNIYRGKIQLSGGTASINLDSEFNMSEGTFEALNREIQCFTSNETSWSNVRGSVNGNVLTIECQDPSSSDEISWLVIGERKDPEIMNANSTDENGRVITEFEKTPEVESDLQKSDPMNNPIPTDEDSEGEA